MVRSSHAFDRMVAFHEAGHAVVGVQLGKPITHVSIEPSAEAGSEGHAVFRSLPPDFQPDAKLDDEEFHTLVSEAAIAVAGRAAAQLTGHRRASWGCMSDLEWAWYVLSFLGSDPEDDSPSLLLRWITARVKIIVTEREALIAAVADQLIEHRQLEESALINLIRPTFSISETAKTREYTRKFGRPYINPWVLG